MKKILISVLKYTISLAIAVLLLWYVFKDIDVNDMRKSFINADYKWVFISIVIALISHLWRSLRWNLILQPLGHSPKVTHTYMAVLIGYLANFVIPRMGEVSRCGILHRIDKIPFKTSIGTVVAERAFDLICLLFVIAIALLFEFNRLKELFAGIFINKFGSIEVNLNQIYLSILIFIFIIAVTIFIFIRYKKKIIRTSIFIKILAFWQGVREGILSILRLKNKWLFLFYTFLMWLFYFLGAYTVFFSLEPTSKLSPLTGLSVLVAGSLGMTTPVQGGFGAFHFLVRDVLYLYDVPLSDGLAYATLLHSSQAITIILIGTIFLFITLIISKKLNKNR